MNYFGNNMNQSQNGMGNVSYGMNNGMPMQQQPALSVVMITDQQSVDWYPVATNNTVFLIDFNNNKFYIKSKNEMGIQQPIRAFSFNEIVQQMPQQVATNQQMVSREEFEELKKMLEDLTAPNK